MKPTELKELLKSAQNKTALFQAHIDEQLLDQVKAQRIKDGISWRKLIETLFGLYLKETKVGKGK